MPPEEGDPAAKTAPDVTREAARDAMPMPEDPAEPAAAGRSLLSDVEALIEDGKTYLDAEIGFQKTRATFVTGRVKTAVLCGIVAILVGFVALMSLTVGAIIALTPMLTAWGATATVAGSLFLLVAICVVIAIRNVKGLIAAFRSEEK